jgi:hypothetical protein
MNVVIIDASDWRASGTASFISLQHQGIRQTAVKQQKQEVIVFLR